MENQEREEDADKRFARLCQQAATYCAYQERTHKQVIQKLQTLEASENDIEDIVEWLLHEKFLDNERFGRAYSGGKFRFKKWGRLKIKQGLKQQGIQLTDELQNSLSVIDENEYRKTLKSLIDKKNKSLKEDLSFLQRKSKLYMFAASKGYESGLIRDMIAQILNDIPDEDE